MSPAVAELSSADQLWLSPYLPRPSIAGTHPLDASPPSADKSVPTSSTSCHTSPDDQAPSRPFVTLTYATSLDAALAHARGQPTPLSGPKSKAMTHHLRATHDAILIGAGTAVADDPALNCRLSGPTETHVSQPRPVIIDPSARWTLTPSSRLSVAVQSARAKAPWVIATCDPSPEKLMAITAIGGRYIRIDPGRKSTKQVTPAPGAGHDAGQSDKIAWSDIFQTLHSNGIGSVMVEGGARVIGSLLAGDNCHLLDSVIVTLAPVWLGVDAAGGVLASPERAAAGDAVGSAGGSVGGGVAGVAALRDVTWHQLGDDVVLCARVRKTSNARDGHASLAVSQG